MRWTIRFVALLLACASGGVAASAGASATGVVFGELIAGDPAIPQPGRVVTLIVPGAPPRTTKSDGRGRFEFGDVPGDAACEIDVAADGCATVRVPDLRLVPFERRDVGELRLGPPARLDVLVVDDRGAPIPGATVDVHRDATGPFADCVERSLIGVATSPTQTAAADAKGRARFDLPPHESCTVVASARGRARVVETEIARPRETERPLVFALPPAATLTGRVVDRAGKAVVGAQVFAARVIPMVGSCGTCWHEPQSHVRRLRADTDAQGRFAFDSLAPGDTVVFATSGAAFTDSIGVALPSVGDVELTLNPASPVEGRVTDAATGAPIAGVVLGAGTLAATDADGRYVLDGVPTEIAPPPGWARSRLDDVRACDLSLRRAGVVTGKVSDDGKPVPFARVVAVTLPEELDGWVPATARGRADADGAFRLDDVLPGGVALYAVAPDVDSYVAYDEFYEAVCKTSDGRARAAFDVASGAVVERGVSAWRLSEKGREKSRELRDVSRLRDDERAFVVRGRVTTADGAPLLDARVLAAGDAGLVRDLLDENLGRPPAPDGSFVVEATAWDRERKIVLGAVDGNHDVAIVEAPKPAEGVSDVELNVVLPARPLLKGRVASGGKPVAGAMIVRRGVAVARTGVEGEFATPCGSDMSWQFEVRAKGFVTKALDKVEVPSAEPVEVELAPAFAIAGRVVDGEGRPLARLVVGAFQDEERPAAATATDADGVFRVDGLPAGAWTLAVASAPGAATRIGELWAGPFAAGASNVRLVARPGRRIAGRVVAPDGAPAKRLDVTCARKDEAGRKREARTDSDGRFSFDGLAEGDFAIDVDPGRNSSFAALHRDVAAGTTDLALVLGGADSVAGTLVDQDGRPLADVEIEAICLDENLGDASTGRWKDLVGKTDAKGAFRIFVPRGTRFQLSLGKFSRLRAVASLAGGDDVKVGATDVRLVADCALAVRALVVDERGAPIAHASVDAQLFGSRRSDIQTGADGRFSIGPLAPLEYVLVLTAPGRVPVRMFRVKPGKTEMRIVMRAGATITGKLLDADGKPDRAHAVRALSTKASWAAADLWHATPDADGRFELTGLDDGEWMLEAFAPKADGGEDCAALGTFKAGAKDLELRPKK